MSVLHPHVPVHLARRALLLTIAAALVLVAGAVTAVVLLTGRSANPAAPARGSLDTGVVDTCYRAPVGAPC